METDNNKSNLEGIDVQNIENDKIKRVLELCTREELESLRIYTGSNTPDPFGFEERYGVIEGKLDNLDIQVIVFDTYIHGTENLINTRYVFKANGEVVFGSDAEKAFNILVKYAKKI